MAEHDPWQWPALQGAERPQALAYERGIWGKAHGIRSDFRWLAATGGFTLRHSGLEQAFSLGSEDLPQRTQAWRALGDAYYAVACYKSRAEDAAGRGNFLERQIIEWRPAGHAIPAALGALIVLPEAARYTDALWWDRRDEGRWGEAGFALPLGPQCCPPLSVDGIGPRVENSIRLLKNAVPLEALEQFYTAVLAGHRAVALPGLGQALPPEALAALLLPLHRDMADRFSLINWLPSQHANTGDLRISWDAVLGGGYPDLANGSPEPTEAQRQQAGQMAEALYAQDPGRLQWLAKPAGARPAAAALQLAIWGASSAGKTVLIAQLFLEHFGKDGDWLIGANETSLKFIQNMRQSWGDNSFPPATVPGFVEQLNYQFFNRATGVCASLMVENRAGRDYEEQKEDIRQRMKAAAGLVLLIDPYREKRLLIEELDNLFRHMQVDRQEAYPQDSRPIAICLSKADALIENPADLRHALEQPDDFVKTRDRWGLAPLFDRYCSNYRFFPVSAVGVDLRYGIAESNTFYDENLNLRVKGKSQSFNLMPPFVWLIDQLEAARP